MQLVLFYKPRLWRNMRCKYQETVFIQNKETYNWKFGNHYFFNEHFYMIIIHQLFLRGTGYDQSRWCILFKHSAGKVSNHFDWIIEELFLNRKVYLLNLVKLNCFGGIRNSNHICVTVFKVVCSEQAGQSQFQLSLEQMKAAESFEKNCFESRWF